LDVGEGRSVGQVGGGGAEFGAVADEVVVEAEGQVLHGVMGEALGQFVAVEVEVFVAGEGLEVAADEVAGLES